MNCRKRDLPSDSFSRSFTRTQRRFDEKHTTVTAKLFAHRPNDHAGLARTRPGGVRPGTDLHQTLQLLYQDKLRRWRWCYGAPGARHGREPLWRNDVRWEYREWLLWFHRLRNHLQADAPGQANDALHLLFVIAVYGWR